MWFYAITAVFAIHFMTQMVCFALYRSSSWTTLDRLATVTLPCWIATLPTSPASSLSFRRRLTVVQARSLRTNPRPSNLVTLPWSTWSPRSPCASRLSPTTHPWDVLPYVTWGRPLLSVSSRPWPRRRPPVAKSPRPPRRLPVVRRSEGGSRPKSTLQTNSNKKHTTILTRLLITTNSHRLVKITTTRSA